MLTFHDHLVSGEEPEVTQCQIQGRRWVRTLRHVFMALPFCWVTLCSSTHLVKTFTKQPQSALGGGSSDEACRSCLIYDNDPQRALRKITEIKSWGREETIRTLEISLPIPETMLTFH